MTVFLQLSDIHILAGEGELLGAQPAESLRRVLARIEAVPVVPDFCLISGDLAQESGIEGYRFLKQLLEPLVARGMPVLVGMGNHDDRAAFREGFLGEAGGDARPYYYAATHGGVRVLMLDTLIPGAVDGMVGEEQMAWLREQLRQPGEAETIVVMHHPAAPTGIGNVHLRDADALRAVIEGRRVLGVLAGHCHIASATQFAGTIASSAPAVVFQLVAEGEGGMRVVQGSGFNLCAVRDGVLLVNPVMV
jgi:3',5'-cyclic AMP phosphodiesterase CpdA